MRKFDNKIALVTGATSGIGEATAKRFATCGADVIIVGRNEERGRKIEDDICKNGGKAVFISCDVGSESDVDKLREFLANRYGVLHILFNNAGVMPPSSEIERMTVENWDLAFDTNIKGTFLVTRAVKDLLENGKGCIINNASIAGLQHYAIGRSYAYSASKAAVIQFSHQMAKNYGEIGIRVNCICPGIIDTPCLGDRDRKVYAERVPLGYVGVPEDVAKVVEFLASDDASYVTGAVITVDGGVSL